MRAWPVFLIALILFVGGGSVAAERELHVVAAHEGWIEPGDFLHEPQARVIVDRPDAQVVLVLLDAGHVDWIVETTTGSLIETIILGGNGTSSSRVSLNGVPFVLPHDDTLPYVNNSLGKDFRQLLRQLSDRTGLDRITSFQAAHTADQSGYRVDRVDRSTVTLATDYLQYQVRAAHDLPLAIRRWMGGERQETAYSAAFDETGMTLTDAKGSRFFPVPPEMSPPILPAGTYFDAVNEVLYGISNGGEGRLYQVDTETGRWQVLANLQGYDGAELLYHRGSDQFVMTGAFSRPGEIRILKRDGVVRTINIEVRRFPGLTDLFDYANEPAPALRPRVFEANWLLVEAYGEKAEAFPGRSSYRVYAVNLANEEVRLLEYVNE